MDKEQKTLAIRNSCSSCRRLHQYHAFEEKIAECYEELHANPQVAQFDVLAYLRDWLIHHIRVEDARLIELARN